MRENGDRQPKAPHHALSVGELVGGRSDAPPSGDRAEATRWWRSREGAVFYVFLVAIFAAFQLHLGTVIISDMDEGTYLYAGQLINQGLVPYRDFMLAHPPMIAMLGAALLRVLGPSIMSARIAYLVLVLASTVPLYALVRHITRSQRAALLSIVSYTTGMLVIANMGRTVRLEPLMNAFLICGFACRFLRPRSAVWMAVMGALFAGSLFVKAIAVVPAALLFLGDLVWDRPIVPLVRRWLAALVGFGLALGPGLAWCLSQNRFVEDVLLGQIHRPRIELEARLHYLVQNVTRYPPILVGLVAAAIFMVKARDARVRTVSFVALGSTIVLVFAFKTFFNYYIVQAMPWIACVFAIAVDQLGDRWLGGRWPRIALALASMLGVIGPLGYAEVYHRLGRYHVLGPQRIVSLLEGGKGYVYSMYPAFGLWTGRPLYPWYYQADSLVPRLNRWIADKELVDVFSGSTALVLYSGELDDYAIAREYMQKNFSQKYADTDWSLWERSPVEHAVPAER